MTAVLFWLIGAALILALMALAARWTDNVVDPGPRPIFDDMCAEQVHDGAGDLHLLRRAEG